MKHSDQSSMYMNWTVYCRENNISVSDIKEAINYGYSIGKMYCSMKSYFDDKTLVEELRKRGYDVKCTKTQIIEL